MKIPKEIEDRIVHADNCRCPTCRRKAAWEGVGVDPGDEKQFMAEVIKLAKKNGWDCFHCYNSRKSAAGFPDLVLWRDRVFFAELKTETGKLTAAQETVIEGLRKAGAEVYVFRPSDWSRIVEILK